MTSDPSGRSNTLSARLSVLVWAAAVMLTICSYFVVMTGATEEPYFSFAPRQAFVQVGIATSLITLWIVWALMLVATVTTRMIHWKWLLALLWAVIVIIYLSACPYGYVYDMEQVFLGYLEANC